MTGLTNRDALNVYSAPFRYINKHVQRVCLILHPMRMKMATFMGKLLLFLSVYVSQVKAQSGRAYRKFVLLYTRNTYLATRCGNLSPVGLRTRWVTIREYCLTSKGPYVVLSFLLLLFCVLCGFIVNSVLRSRFSIISVSGFRKRKKQRTNMARCSSPENYYSSGRNTELKLCRL